MEGAGQSGGSGADDQDIGLKSFALYGHRFISLAEHANWMLAPRHPGVLYRCENKGVEEKGICKRLKIRGLQIDRAEGGICKCLKTWE
jgi:hypothetical protein